MQKLTRERLRKAESDLRVAKLLARHKPKPNDQICFHCQQAVEKYLKALLQEGGLSIPRTHDLEDLHDLLAPAYPQLGVSKSRLGTMTDYAVGYRYPGMHATSGNTKSSLRLAEQVRLKVRLALGLPAQPKKS